MANRYAWLALGLGAYIAFALSMFPAGAAYRWFAPDTLHMTGITGTVWSGRAALATAQGLPLNDLRWQLDALPLLIGRAAGRVQARLAEGLVDARVSGSLGGRVLLRDVQLATRLEVLASAVSIGDVRGRVTVRLERIAIEDGVPTTAVGQVRVAELQVPTFVPGGRGDLLPLGDYELILDDTGSEGLRARFRDTSGPLAVDGVLTVDLAGRYMLDARAEARQGAPRELVQALELMGGEPAPDGRRPFQLSGSL